jgi:hypothetical protein
LTLAKNAAERREIVGQKVVGNQVASWSECPPLKPPAPNAPDLTGLRRGSLTAIGMLDKTAAGYGPAGGDGRWVVRCDCGRYEVRRARSLSVNANDACQDCR